MGQRREAEWICLFVSSLVKSCGCEEANKFAKISLDRCRRRPRPRLRHCYILFRTHSTFHHVPTTRKKRVWNVASQSHNEIPQLFLSLFFCLAAAKLMWKWSKCQPTRSTNSKFSYSQQIDNRSQSSFSGAFAGNSRKFRQEFLTDFPTPGTGPHFDTSIVTNVTGLVGKTVHLVCKVKNLGNKTVSVEQWSR